MESRRKVGNGILYLVLSVVVSLVGLLMPELMIIAGIAALAFYIASILLLPYVFALVPPAATFFLALLLGYNYYVAALFAGLILPAAAGIAYCIRTKQNMLRAFITGLCLSSVWMIADFGAYVYIRGGELSANGLKIAFQPFITYFTDIMNSAVSTYKEVYPELGKQMESYFSGFSDTIIKAISNAAPSIIISVLCVMIFVALLISKRILYKNGVDVSSLKLFRDFKLPKSAVAFFVVCIIGELIFTGFAGTAFYNIYSVLSTLFLISGLSFLSFWFNVTGVHPVAKRIIFILFILMSIVPLGFSMILSGAGVLDSITNIRARLEMKKETSEK